MKLNNKNLIRILILLVSLAGIRWGFLAGWTPDQQASFLILIAAAVLWVTEWLSMAWTSVGIGIALTAFGVVPPFEVIPQYFDPVIFVFLSGFVLAVALEQWELPNLLLHRLMNTRHLTETRLLWRWLFLIAFASMWMSNTAAFLVFYPLLKGLRGVREELKKALLFGGAFSASIGGIATPVGSPPNLILISYLRSANLVSPSFLEWMLKMIPLTLLLLAMLGWVLTLYFKLDAREKIALHDSKQGLLNETQKKVLILGSLMVVLWLVRPFLMPAWSDATVGMSVAVLFFFIPVSRSERMLGVSALKQIPWSILLLFGGGLALSLGIQRSNLLELAMSSVHSWFLAPWVVVLFFVVAISILMTEFVSNTAMAAVLLPILGGLLQRVSEFSSAEQLSLLWACAIGGSLSFMMPMATPVNAMVFSSRLVKIQEMVRLGALLNLVCAAVITLYFFALSSIL